jgi:hypothetical protein
MMIFARKPPGWRKSSESNVRRPREEQLAHLRFIGRRRISRGVTPSRRAQAWTSALNTSTGTASSSVTQSEDMVFFMQRPSATDRGSDLPTGRLL